jgi:hypothetical protein
VEGGFVLRRTLALVAVAGLALLIAGSALAASVTVRVEGKTRSIFGATPVTVEAGNALEALEQASLRGEFHYVVTSLSFGDYISQIGRYAAEGNGGWVFKVNGASPPVGADQVVLADGDEVLWYWATFGASGGPPTLRVEPDGANCYVVWSIDDAGVRRPAATARLHVDGRRAKVDARGRGCVGKHRGAVRAFAVGAVRSNAAK